MGKILTIIPSRYAASRLPGKPLIDIAGKPMIVRAYEQAVAVDLGPVVVATDDDRIAGVVRAAGGEAVMTRPDHVSGSDRIYEALTKIDPDGQFEFVLNLQGDVPLVEPQAVRDCFAPMKDPAVDIGTIATLMKEEQKTNPSFVKAIGTPLSEKRLRALYFTRATAPSGEGPLYLHIGLYAYRRAALERFINLPASPLEKREKLEQLRALEDGMRIDVTLVDSVPIDVNTPEDVADLKKILAGRE
ncbi:MAG: 3-deoxy-manno-octulosonate cytidylyltransferase [Stappiaceae bacterium]